MSNVPMPEPVAWVRRHPDGALSAEYLRNEAIEPVRKESGAWIPMITTTQAQAYTDARVKEALEEAAAIVDANATACTGQIRKGLLRSNAAAIRALIPNPPTEKP